MLVVAILIYFMQPCSGTALLSLSDLHLLALLGTCKDAGVSFSWLLITKAKSLQRSGLGVKLAVNTILCTSSRARQF